MNSILIIKTAALGDVLRTTSVLRGLKNRYGECSITWVTARAAVDLVRTNPLVNHVESLDTSSDECIDRMLQKLGDRQWDLIVSLDDEILLCRLASRLSCKKLSGAYLSDEGQRVYTPDVAEWFDMGMISVHGKKRADELKVLNQRSHPKIYADMLGIEMGKPKLLLTEDARSTAKRFAARHNLLNRFPLIGLNTGAGGRWVSKQLSPERTVALAVTVSSALKSKPVFIVFGGPAESERNQAIAAGLDAAGVACVDAGTDNALLDFAGIVGLCHLLVTSDSLALHIALAQDVRVVAFFAPTSAAEIELYGLGEKIVSTASDYCSYKPDADNSTITPERLAPAVIRQLQLLKET